MKALENHFLSSLRLNKAFDAQNGTAAEWTVGPNFGDLVHLWSHVLAIRMVMTLTMESCEGVICDGLCRMNQLKKFVNIFFLSIFF